MKNKGYHQKRNSINRLLSLTILAAVLFGLVAPGGFALAANPNGDSYIIVFNDSVADPTAEAQGLARAYGLQTGFIYQYALKGMSAVVPEGRLIALQHDPRVAYVVEDMQRSISAQIIPTGIRRIFADKNSAIAIDGNDDYRVDVDVAVIDTGIDLQHPELNVVDSVSCLYYTGRPRDRVYYCAEGGDDDHYHGTHVAGTIAALDNGTGVVGVAPGARLWAVKVCNSSGSCPTSAIIAGVDYVTQHAADIEVANMSLGGSGFNQAEYDAIQGAVEAGVAFAVAAGNNSADAINYSPGGFDNVLSVSALADFDGLPGSLGTTFCFTDQDDTLAYFSNYGEAVDVTAPGGCIYSTFPLEQGGYGTISGTSMASPHAAGALALLASRSNPGNADDVLNLYATVKNNGNYDWTDDSPDGIQEPLLDVSKASVYNPVLVSTGGGGENTPPSVTISSPADEASFPFGTSISFSGSATDTEDGDLTNSLVWTSDLVGEIGTGGSFDAVLSAGTHTITASVTDSGSLTGSASITVIVDDPPAGDTVTVSSLTGVSTTINKNFWRATATVTISPALSGAVVSGLWDSSKAASCTTDGAGQCTLSVSVRTTTSSITFTVENVALAGYSYVPGDTTETIYKP